MRTIRCVSFGAFFRLRKKEAVFHYNESSEKRSVLEIELQITEYPQSWLCESETWPIKSG